MSVESLINAFEALPEDVRSAEIIIKGTPRRTLQNSEIFNFPLITHIINQILLPIFHYSSYYSICCVLCLLALLNPKLMGLMVG
jgi:hypothetical protein